MKSFLFAADLDPCRNIKCKFYGKCKATGPSSAVCTCDYPCPAYDELVCDSRGVTFANLCEYQKEVCRMKKEPPLHMPVAVEVGITFQLLVISSFMEIS